MPQSSLILQVERGDTVHKIANTLGAKDILSLTDMWVLVAYLSGKSARIQTGDYEITSTMTAIELLNKLANGEVIKTQITLPEGWTFEQMKNALDAQPHIIKTLTKNNFQKFVDKLKIPTKHVEGWFFPDSYRYDRSTTDADIFEKAHRKMVLILDEQWNKRASGLPYRSAYEALIMASIIEKETGVPAERAQIASVFVNRLKKGMPLQTDPAVIYGLGKSYKGNITKAHLQQDTPYNTYTRVGLPPTPIANPGQAAIEAALHPAETEYLYFVGKGDGTHYFSTTLAEHNQAVTRYQLRPSREYRSQPQKSEGAK